MEKSVDEILEQKYLTAEDLHKIIPTINVTTCREYIEEIRKEMEQKNLITPGGRPKLALTKLVRKRFGF